MKILDHNHARNWAQKHLKYPFVLVDEVGNIHCVKTADAIAKVVADKTKDGKAFYMVKGALPAIPVTPDKPKDDAK